VNTDETAAITKNGITEAVVVSMKKYEGLLETLEILSEKNKMISFKLNNDLGSSNDEFVI